MMVDTQLTATITREYKQAKSGCVVFDHSQQGKIEVVGREARFFLHNLCTNDIRTLPVLSWCEAFFTTATAKVVAYVKIACLSDDARGTSILQLDVAPGTSQKILKHLDHYLISEQVEFIDRTAEMGQFYLAGPSAIDLLQGLLPTEEASPAPSHLMITELHGIPTQLRRDDSLGLVGYNLFFPVAQSEKMRQIITDASAMSAGPELYEILRVEAGTPAAELDIDETTFAPEVGRQPQAISYNKGCYLGQEPIVMARDRGQVNRKLVGLKWRGDPVPHGSLVYRDDKEIGRVTSCAQSPEFGLLALAYIRRGHHEPGTIIEIEANGVRQTATVR